MAPDRRNEHASRAVALALSQTLDKIPLVPASPLAVTPSVRPWLPLDACERHVHIVGRGVLSPLLRPSV